MKSVERNIKIGMVSIGVIFVFTGVYLLYKEQYGLGVVVILALLLVYKADGLIEFAYSTVEGFRAKFKTPPDKVEENIRENDVPVTNKNFISFRNIESRILSDLQKRYGGEMKTLVHFVYGRHDKPDFFYTPDGSLQAKDTLYFFEIKYVIKPVFAPKIVNNAFQYLKEVRSKLLPSMGDSNFVIKLVLASGYDLSEMPFNPPKGIEVEFYKI